MACSYAAGNAMLRGHLDGIGFAAIGVVGNDIELEMPGVLNSERVAGDERHIGARFPCMDGG